jgi:putative zinc ribbon protein
MEDKALICGECGKPFSYTVGEQQMYQERGMQDPEICKDCRRGHFDESSASLREGEGGGQGGPFSA